MSNDMVRFVEVQGWQVAVEGVGDAEAKIRDIDLAEKLGYTRPRDIRKLIERLIKEGKLLEVCMRASVSRIQKSTGGVEEREVQEYWLTEAQALKVIAKSGTHIADQILDQVIAVFVYVRKSHNALAPSQTADALLELQAKAAHLREMRPYYEDTIAQLEELEAAGVITKETKLAHRTRLLRDVAGIDLTKAPAMEFQNTTLLPAASVKVEEIKATGDLPVKQVTVTAEADLTGFRTCASIASEIGASPAVVSKIGRAMGWFGKTDEVAKNQFGVWVPIIQNGKQINKNWQYSDKLIPEFRTLWMKSQETKKAMPKKTSWDKVIPVVCDLWKKRRNLLASSP